MKNRNRFFLIVYLVLLLVSLGTVIYAGTFVDWSHLQKNDYILFNNNWVDENQKEVELPLVKDKTTMQNIIPELNNDSVISIVSKNVNFDILIDGKIVYEKEKYNEKIFGKVDAATVIEIPLSREDSGKVITFNFSFPYNDSSGKITSIMIGRGSDITLHYINSSLYSYVTGIIAIFFGLAVCLAFVLMWKKKIVDQALLYFGIFALNIGIYVINDSRLYQIMYNCDYFYHLIGQLWMLLIVIPLFLFLDKTYNNSNKKFVSFACGYSVICFIICYTLHILGIKDFHETMVLNHISFALIIGYMAWLVVKSFMSKNKKNIPHCIGVIAICICAALDILLYRVSGQMETSYFTKMAFLIFIFVEGIQIMIKYLEQHEKNMKVELLSKLAYQDGLTELPNRTSFMEDMVDLESHEQTNGLIAMFDVNNLKKVNDELGHNYGDQMIIMAASVIFSSFGSIGKCYRIGGDEFVFISKDTNEESFLKQYHVMLKKIEEINQQKNPFTLSIAMGYSLINNEEKSMSEILDEADINMYENKKEMKKAR